MTKSAVGLACEAFTVGQQALPRYASRFSKHDFIQPQLFALLVVRQFLKTDYRGLVTLLAEWSELRCLLKLKKVPHYSTLCYAERRLLADAEKGAFQWAVIARARHAGLIDDAPVAAIDATGLEARHVSLYYRIRRGVATRSIRRRLA